MHRFSFGILLVLSSALLSAGCGGESTTEANILRFTPEAARQARSAMSPVGASHLRVTLDPKNLHYKIEMVTGPRDGDYVGESEGVAIVMDSDTAYLIPTGTTVDYLSENGQSGFHFQPPGNTNPSSSTATNPSISTPGNSNPGSPPPGIPSSVASSPAAGQHTLGETPLANARKQQGGPLPPFIGGRRYPLDQPPPGEFQIVRYDSEVGHLPAYLTPDPGDGQKHPAIVWITGGDCNTIGDVWSPQPSSNDQSARQYRDAGIVMMFPSLRGGNINPGRREAFLGEVNDVLAAADFLAQQSYVDPNRIYLGGHSTGGTLVLLTSEYAPRFRAVFSFGPADDVSGYGVDLLQVRLRPTDVHIRSPIHWLNGIRSPTFVIEATDGNLQSLQAMQRKSINPKVQFFIARGTDHFGVLAPVNKILAAKILQDTGSICNITLTEAEVNQPFGR